MFGTRVLPPLNKVGNSDEDNQDINFDIAKKLTMQFHHHVVADTDVQSSMTKELRAPQEGLPRGQVIPRNRFVRTLGRRLRGAIHSFPPVMAAFYTSYPQPCPMTRSQLPVRIPRCPKHYRTPAQVCRRRAGAIVASRTI